MKIGLSLTDYFTCITGMVLERTVHIQGLSRYCVPKKKISYKNLRLIAITHFLLEYNVSQQHTISETSFIKGSEISD